MDICKYNTTSYDVMVKCPYCNRDFGNIPAIEKIDITELPEDSVIVYCPNCSAFLDIAKGRS
jgi:Zn finger protein HypA/HybF involved in hydrogenase expression